MARNGTEHHRLRDQDVVIEAEAGGVVCEIRNEPWHRVEVGAIVGLIEE